MCPRAAASTYRRTPGQPQKHSDTGTFVITDIPEREYGLSKPIRLKVELDEGRYIVSHGATSVFGHHASREQAFINFYKAIVRDYELLFENRDRLSAAMQRRFREFEKIILRRQ